MTFIRTFLDELASTLGVGIGTIATFFLCAVMGVILITNWRFFLSYVLAVGDWIIFQLSKIPFFANGTYLSKIRKYKAVIKETRELQEELEGQKQELLNDYSNNEEECQRAIRRARYLKEHGKEAEALSYSKTFVRLQADNKKIMESQIPDLESAAEAAERKIARLSEEIRVLKHDRKTTNKALKTTKILERANESLLGDNTEADDQILENYREYVTAKRIRAQGSEVVLSKLPSEKAKSLDDSILVEEAKNFLQSL